MARTALPPRPLTLSATFVSGRWTRAILVALLGAVIVVVTLAMTGMGAVDIARQASLSVRGTAAPYTSISGKVKTTNIVYHDHDLSVSYQDEAGTMHRHQLSFSTLFLSADKDLKPQVWYDPANPDRFALNLATERAGSRILLLVCALVIFGGIGVAIVFAARSTLNTLKDARTVAGRSEELRVTIVSVEDVRNQKGAPTGKRRWHWKGTTASGASVSGATEFEKGHTPLYGDATEKTLVALYAEEAPKGTIVLRDDLYPFTFDAAERERIRREATAPELGVG